MNFADIELRLRYPEVFRDSDALTPPDRVMRPAAKTRDAVSEKRGLAVWIGWLLARA